MSAQRTNIFLCERPNRSADDIKMNNTAFSSPTGSKMTLTSPTATYESKMDAYVRMRKQIAPFEELATDIHLGNGRFGKLEEDEVNFLVKQIGILAKDSIKFPLDMDVCKQIAEDIADAIETICWEYHLGRMGYLKVIMADYVAVVESLKD